MREIKFRTWDKTDKKMHFDRAIDEDGYPCVLFADEHINSPSEIIMQFTGLKDKNGKEIYEGDILGHKDKRYNSKVNMLVKYDIYYCEEYGDIIGFKFDTSLEVIGNKFKNPELLK